MTATRLFFAVAVAAAGSTVGCSDTKTERDCTADSECKAGLFCQAGACRCRTDDSCDPGNYCNPYGSCQPRPACLGNQDCHDGEICNSADVSGGSCIPADKCGSGVHCELNNYCAKAPGSDPNAPGTCAPGCRSTGDCQLGRVCAAGQCVAGGTAADCSICPASPTPDPSYCDYGEQCSAQGQCVAAPFEAQLCVDCTASNTCSGDLICLIDPDTNNTSYCAPSCRIDTDCPAGYTGCGGLSLVFAECRSAADCRNGGECLGRSESNRGFCECLSNDECDPFAGICQIDPLFGGGACGLSYCNASQAASCAQYGAGVQCADQKQYLCDGVFGPGHCQLGQCSQPSDCALFGPTVTCTGGACVGASCTSGDQCVCVNHRCAMDGSACDTAADCMTGVCVMSCSADADCMCVGGRCSRTELPCQTAADCAVNCEEGRCITAAKACGKEAGVSCQDLTTGTAECRQF
ncbi:MAG: hypothetical protein HY903_10040 [Deltaproteobacteria bacterium]|nr:hypothetical protein [Deltaproteobacteria bacterium]